MNLDVNGMGEEAGDGRVVGERKVMWGKSHCYPKAILLKFIFIK